MPVRGEPHVLRRAPHSAATHSSWEARGWLTDRGCKQVHVPADRGVGEAPVLGGGAGAPRATAPPLEGVQGLLSLNFFKPWILNAEH